MATNQLALYNIALRACGTRTLDSLAEARMERRDLDKVWDEGTGAINRCLEQGLWNFAMRAVQVDKSSSVTPSFGFNNAFDKPTDYIRLASISGDEYFNEPLTNYEFEGDYFYADIDPIYLRYVSNDSDWGNNLSRWPDSFVQYVGHWLGLQIYNAVWTNHPTAAAARAHLMKEQELEKKTERLLHDARSKDAQAEPPRFTPMTSWQRARHGWSTGTRERGKRGQLIG